MRLVFGAGERLLFLVRYGKPHDAGEERQVRKERVTPKEFRAMWDKIMASLESDAKLSRDERRELFEWMQDVYPSMDEAVILSKVHREVLE